MMSLGNNVVNTIVTDKIVISGTFPDDLGPRDCCMLGPSTANTTGNTTIYGLTGDSITSGVYRFGWKDSNGGLHISDKIDFSKLLARSFTSGSLPTQQVSYVGYNGSTGSLDVINDNDYLIRVKILSEDPTLFGKPYIKEGLYRSDSTATEKEIATGLNYIMNKNFKRESWYKINFERVGSSASVAAFGTATIIKFTKGSKSVAVYTKTGAGNVNLTASTTSVTAADVINIPTTNGRSFTFTASACGGAGVGSHVIYIGPYSIYVLSTASAAANAAAVAAAINLSTNMISTVASASAASTTVTVTYKAGFYGLTPMVLSSADDATFANVTITIASGDATPVKYLAYATTSAAATFLLDTEWLGETGYAYTGTTAATNTGIGTAPTAWGIKMTGVSPFANNLFIAGTTKYEVPSFKTTVSGFTSTTVYDYDSSVSTSLGSAASKGTGSYWEASELEWNTQGEEGKKVRMGLPLFQSRSNALSTDDYYDVVMLKYYDDSFTSDALGLNPKAVKTLLIYGATVNGTVCPYFSTDNSTYLRYVISA